MPDNFKPKDANNPYADYTVEQLYQFLSGYTLTRDIGSKYEYSNLGGGLLGHTLARRAGMDYEALMRARIATPLGMQSTVITLSPAMKERLATGHNDKLEPVANWDLPTLAGAGAIRSTTNDMLTLLEAFLGYKDSPLAPAMKAMLEVHRPTDSPAMQTGLAWLILPMGPQEVVWHNGGTGGYRTSIGFDAKARTGVVVLANTSTALGVDDIGLHLLNPRSPLANPKPPTQHTEIHVDSKIFNNYVGIYQLAPGVSIEITRDGDHLYAQLTGQGKIEIFAESEREYFLKVTDAQVTFETNAEGRATGIVLHQLGRDAPAKRVE
jgi:D-alanyl-D-alanine-carboxypeptidase/D-alanyl-D-alanine-endopeptidase